MMGDIRFGLRSLRRSPGFTLVAVVALALGIGANTAIFSVVNSVLLRPLPYKDADRLVQLWGQMPTKGIPFHFISYADMADLRELCRSFEFLSAYSPGSVNLVTGDEPERVPVLRVNASFFPMIGVAMRAGRVFLPDEDRPDGARVAVIAHNLWQRRFGSDPNLVGRTLLLDGDSYTVVGVLPEGFQFVRHRVDLYLPLAWNAARDPASRAGTVGGYARLKAGVSMRQAQAEVDTVVRRLQDQYASGRAWSVRIWACASSWSATCASACWCSWARSRWCC